ncbi:hypothetical protein FLL45_21550 [Aliikangiella marina]|uniref:NTF2 fold domain-containing protein n=1 Tax=Aliikangiella marina TaxID=1712262 RepID=A0A545T119_9GAMM|nr:hypothetical protein [Aliikangiella marina]TQV70915.1 hypothetical protein FLL45_21550 [Aliikangiella marina]
MVKNIVLLGLILIATLLTNGCSNNNTAPTQPAAIAKLLDKQGEIVGTTTDEKRIQKIVHILNERKELKEKLLPIFEYEVQVKEQKWLLTTNGYIRDNSKNNGKIYKLKNTKKIIELISVK